MNQHASIVPDQRRRILDAAERCFVRSGFHRATMQDVAAEAAMSAGNIYRYFPSKDAIIAGLTARDRAEIANSFGALEGSADPFGQFVALGRRHIVEDPREKAVFLLDLWAESARNPAIAEIARECEDEVRGWIAGFVRHLIARKDAPADLNVRAVVDLLLCMGDGLLARRAREPGFDASSHMDHLVDVLRLACAGQIPSLLGNGPSSDAMAQNALSTGAAP
jgi:AcrR family transcriptional regulator